MVLVAEEITNYISEMCKMPLENNKDYNILATSATYHDLGKYWTKRYDKDKINFNNHENVSAVIFVSEMLLLQKQYEQYAQDFQTKTDEEIWYSDELDEQLLYYNDIKHYFDEFLKKTTQIILNHMFIKNESVSEKALKRRQLTDDEIDYLLLFSVADNRCRVV